MALNSTSVQRNLGAKMKVAGLETPDLLFVLIVAATMNLFFGQTSLAMPLGFGLPGLLFLGLFWGKRGKPEKYLIHLLRYHISPGFFSAGKNSKHEEKSRWRISLNESK